MKQRAHDSEIVRANGNLKLSYGGPSQRQVGSFLVFRLQKRRTLGYPRVPIKDSNQTARMRRLVGVFDWCTSQPDTGWNVIRSFAIRSICIMINYLIVYCFCCFLFLKIVHAHKVFCPKCSLIKVHCFIWAATWDFQQSLRSAYACVQSGQGRMNIQWLLRYWPNIIRSF